MARFVDTENTDTSILAWRWRILSNIVSQGQMQCLKPCLRPGIKAIVLGQHSPVDVDLGTGENVGLKHNQCLEYFFILFLIRRVYRKTVHVVQSKAKTVFVFGGKKSPIIILLDASRFGPLRLQIGMVECLNCTAPSSKVRSSTPPSSSRRSTGRLHPEAEAP